MNKERQPLPRQADGPAGRPFWKEALAPYAQPHLGRSVLDIATSVVPYLALSVLMYLALDISYLLVLAIAVPAAGFLVRTYILFHDCTHGSLLPFETRQCVGGQGPGADGLLAVRELAARATRCTTPPPGTSIGAGWVTSPP